MPLITPNFNFDGCCRAAMELYQRAFDAQISSLLLRGDALWEPDHDDLSQEEKQQVYHGELMIGDQRIMMSDNTDIPYNPGSSLSITVTLDTREAVLRAFDIMKEGGQIVYPPQQTPYSSCFSRLVDRFGFSWVIMTEQTEQ